MGTLVLFLPVLLSASMPVPPSDDGVVGDRIEFLGWSPDSKDFAFARIRTRPNGRVRRTYLMKRTSPSGVAQPLRLDQSVTERVRRKGYTSIEVTGRRLSDYEQVFAVRAGKQLRVALEVNRRGLSYSLYLDDNTGAEEPEHLLRGYFRELWTSVDGRVFLSPDGSWAVVLLSLSTPFRTHAWVQGVRIGAPAP